MDEEFKCEICMENLIDSKALPCGHSLCKMCKLDLLQFNDDGSAILNCPSHCKIVTKIQKDQTIDDVLQSNFFVERLLNSQYNKMNAQQNREKIKCQGAILHERSPSFYCQQCRKSLCELCLAKHQCNESNLIKISYDVMKKCIHPICKDHDLFAKFICKECKTFLCVYCKNRTHKDREVNELQSYLQKLKFQINTKFEASKTIAERIKQSECSVWKKMKKCREELAQELLFRKYVDLSKYFAQLNEQERNILKEFDKQWDEFLAQRNQMTNSCDEVGKIFEDQEEVFDLMIISEISPLLEKLQAISNDLSLTFVLHERTVENNLGQLDAFVQDKRRSINDDCGTKPALQDENEEAVVCKINLEKVNDMWRDDPLYKAIVQKNQQPNEKNPIKLKSETESKVDERNHQVNKAATSLDATAGNTESAPSASKASFRFDKSQSTNRSPPFHFEVHDAPTVESVPAHDYKAEPMISPEKYINNDDPDIQVEVQKLRKIMVKKTSEEKSLNLEMKSEAAILPKVCVRENELARSNVEDDVILTYELVAEKSAQAKAGSMPLQKSFCNSNESGIVAVNEVITDDEIQEEVQHTLPRSYVKNDFQREVFRGSCTLFSFIGQSKDYKQIAEGDAIILYDEEVHRTKVVVVSENKIFYQKEVSPDLKLTLLPDSKTMFELKQSIGLDGHVVKFPDMLTAERFQFNFEEACKPVSHGNVFSGSGEGLSFAAGFESNSRKSFAGSGSPLFMHNNAHNDDVEPLVQLTTVAVSNGEEEETVVFNQRCKLYRFDSSSKKWKERGVGNLKLLQHKLSGKSRLLMRREQVGKLCANHRLKAELKLEPFKTNELTVTWHAVGDMSDFVPEDCILAARFKNQSILTEFKERFLSLCEGEIVEGVDKKLASGEAEERVVKPLFGSCDPSLTKKLQQLDL